MAEDFGTQNGFGEAIKGAAQGFASGARMFGQTTKIFGESIGTWVAGVYAFKDSVSSDTFRSLAQKGIQIAGLKTLTDYIDRLVSTVYDINKSLVKDFGAIGQTHMDAASQLNRAFALLGQQGITPDKLMESFSSVAQEYGRIDSMTAQIAARSAIIAQAFSMSADAAGTMAVRMSRQLGSADAVEGYMDGIQRSAQEQAINMNQVGDALSNSVEYMHQFNLQTKQGRINFSNMVLQSAKLGYNLQNVMSATDKFRDFGGAMEGAVMASRFGMNLSAQQLMAARMTGNMEGITETLLDRIQSVGTDEEGNLTVMGREMARALGPEFGLSEEDIARAMSRRAMSPEERQADASMRALNERSVKIQDKIEGLIMRLLSVAVPALEIAIPKIEGWVNAVAGTAGEIEKGLGPAGTLLKFMADHLGKILIAVLAIKAIQMTGRFRGIGGRAMGALGSGIGNATQTGLLKGMMRGGAIGKMSGGLASVLFPGGTPMGGPAPAVGGAAAKGGGMLGQMFGMGAKQILAGSAAMIAFAGAFWVLSKAIQNFVGIDWKTLGVAGATLAGLMVSMVAFGAVMMIPGLNVAIGLGAAAILAFGVAIFLLGKGLSYLEGPMDVLKELVLGVFDRFNSFVMTADPQRLFSIAAGIRDIGGAFAIFGAGQVANAWGNIASFLTGGNPLEQIGKYAERYADPISNLATAMETLASSLERIVKIEKGIKNVNLEGLTKGIASAGGRTGGGREPVIENHIRVDIDGIQVARALSKSLGREM